MLLRSEEFITHLHAGAIGLLVQHSLLEHSQSACLLSFASCPLDPCWAAKRDTVGWDVSRDHRTCSDHTTPTKPHSTGHNTVGTDPYVILDDHRRSCESLLTHRTAHVTISMVEGCNRAMRSDHHMIAKRDPANSPSHNCVAPNMASHCPWTHAPRMRHLPQSCTRLQTRTPEYATTKGEADRRHPH